MGGPSRRHTLFFDSVALSEFPETILSSDTVFQISVPLCCVSDHHPLCFCGKPTPLNPQDKQLAAFPEAWTLGGFVKGKESG